MEGSTIRRTVFSALNLFMAIFMIAAFMHLNLSVARAADSSFANDSDVLGYDNIVGELNREVNRPVISSRSRRAVQTESPLDSLTLHFGVGMASLMEMISFDDGSSSYLGQRGIQVSAGMDMFSPNWQVEGTYRNFGESSTESVRMTMQEWEFKGIFKDHLSRLVGYRIGTGMSARYLNINRGRLGETNYTTPSAIAMLGFDTFVNEVISIGADVTGRSAMINETPDKSSVDFTVRLDTHF